jgi:hypothetical protein
MDYTRGICFLYRVRMDDDVVVADLQFDPSIIEKGDNSPVGLTVNEIAKMISDLANIVIEMHGNG